LLRLRYLDGRIITPEGNEPILLTDPEEIWLVYNGQVDVFAATFREGQPYGARHHLFRAYYGQALFGMSLSKKPVGLLVNAAPDSQLLRVSRTTIEELAADAEFADLVVTLVERWVDDLFSAIGQPLRPREYLELEAGRELQLPKDSIARVRKGVVWISHVEGRSLINSRTDIPPVTIAEVVPVSAYNWLQALVPSRLYVRDTKRILEQKSLRVDLGHFHNLIQEVVARNISRQETAEGDQLQARINTDLSQMQSAFARMASILNPKHAAVATDGDDSLLAACRKVGDAAGIDIQSPPPGTEADKLRRIAQASRMRVRQVALRGEWWKTDAGPMLATLDETKKPVALIPTSSRSYTLYDPADGTNVVVTAAVAGRISPFGYTFYRPLPAGKLNGLDLVRFGLFQSGKDLLMILGMSAAAGLLGLVVPILTGILFDSVIPGGQQPQLVQIGVILIAAAFAGITFQVTRGIATVRLEGRADGLIQAALLDRLLNLPATFFRDFSAGDLGMRVMAISGIRQILSRVAIAAILSAIISAFNLILLFFYNAQLALLALVLVIIFVAVVLVFALMQVRYERSLADLRGKISGTVLQFINGISKFRVAGAERRAFAYWAGQFTQQRQIAFQARSVGQSLMVFNAAFALITSAIIFGAVAPSGGVAHMSTGAFLAFNAAFGQFLVSALTLSAAFASTLSVVPMYERALPILTTLPEVDEARADPGELTGEIEVSSAVFRYRPDGPLVLNNVSLHVDPGEFVALVGPSGSGKSSLLRLMLGFEQPESGAVFYDRQELESLDLRSVRRQIGVVLQNGKLLTGDIFSNIVGSAPLTVEDAWEAARMAGLEEDIKAMPMGMQTLVSEGGSTLSGGQRQRLLIARAIVTRPRIIFFDEATSALDNRTQEIVSQSLDSLEATRVVIAHRLSTIIHAHNIFVVEAGRIVQSGNYDQLMSMQGTFAELARRQLA
ncbi:MAG TPA: NHLP bacteriocin export ABC transporter permease/ATPase subunit, partial [Aggregatilineales bacterium]|nr:NHLP bacteriocin export ABC transporter permease/ATPase subunit [Aggregatilineales bacterium]